MREQRAQHTSISRRAPATADEHLQPPLLLPEASWHRAGHSSGIHPEDQPYQSEALRRRLPPQPEVEDEEDDPPHTRSSAIRRYVTTAPVTRQHPPRRWHPLLRIGLFGIVMVVCTMALLMIPPAYQRWQDDLHYGYPRTYQTDAVVGHGDSASHPSHFIALNLHGHLDVIELPGGDPSKAIIYVGPTLYGQGQDVDPATLSFEDVNHDGRPDLVLHFEGQMFVFLNNGKTFQESHP